MFIPYIDGLHVYDDYFCVHGLWKRVSKSVVHSLYGLKDDTYAKLYVQRTDLCNTSTSTVGPVGKT